MSPHSETDDESNTCWVYIYLLMWDLYYMTNIMPNSSYIKMPNSLYITVNSTIISITRYPDTSLVSTNNGCQNQQINVIRMELYAFCFR